MNPEIFREYDIRGVVDRDFDADFAYKLGRAFYVYLLNSSAGSLRSGDTVNPLKLTVGYDARTSSPSLAKAMVRGLTDSGAHVLELGLITTPVSYFSMFALDGFAGGMMITGSHNPPDYNGFKVSVGKTTIFGSEIQKLKDILVTDKFVSGPGKSEPFDIFPAYLARYKEEFTSLRDIGVVLDCGNGAAGIIARRLFENVGLKPEILFEQPDGKFPNHHPDPTVEHNMTALKAAVVKSKAKVGIGFDGDADRIGLVDETGRFIQGDELMILVTRAILAKNPGAKIVGDVKCSDRLYEDIRQRGGVPIMWKTGHSLIKTKIKEEKCPFGGELSGHVFFADRNYGYDDALYAGLRIVEILSESGKTISQLIGDLPTAFNTPEIRIDTTEEKKWSIVEKLKSVYSHDTDSYKVNFTDGVRISFTDGWALARASNTQPVLVLRFESTSQAGLMKIQNEIEALVKPLL